jgi:hypothetical protein
VAGVGAADVDAAGAARRPASAVFDGTAGPPVPDAFPVTGTAEEVGAVAAGAAATGADRFAPSVDPSATSSGFFSKPSPSATRDQNDGLPDGVAPSAAAGPVPPAAVLVGLDSAAGVTDADAVEVFADAAGGMVGKREPLGPFTRGRCC